MSALKILILTSEFLPFKGGIGTYTREIAIAAADAGHEIVVAAPDYYEDQSALDSQLPFRVVRYRDGTPTMRGLLKRTMLARRLVNEEQFDVVHAADWPFFIGVRLLSGRKLPRRILTFHGSEVSYMATPKRKAILNFIRFCAKGWAEWISNSQYTHERLLKAFPIAPQEARAVPLGVSQSWTNGRINRQTARSTCGVNDEIIIMSLGRIVPRKGHGVLVAALAMLPPELAAKVRWWIVGPLLDDDHVTRLRSAAEQLDVPTTFFGALSDAEVQLRMSAADIFCLPGYRDGNGAVEGFGLAFLEAAAYGVPSIATYSGGIPEAIKEGVTGLLVPEKDVQALADALRLMIGEDKIRANMSVAAIAFADSCNWGRVMANTYRVAVPQNTLGQEPQFLLATGAG